MQFYFAYPPFLPNSHNWFLPVAEVLQVVVPPE